jgi:putative ABC transport system substrate-binding protein
MRPYQFRNGASSPCPRRTSPPASLQDLQAETITRKAVPALSRVAVLWNGANPYPALVYRQTENAARQLGIEVHSFEVRVPGDLEVALETAIRQRPDALITVEDPLMLTHRNRISELATINRLPSLFGLREYVEAGGLIAYGADLGDLNRRAAVYVDKILKGVRPSRSRRGFDATRN